MSKWVRVNNGKVKEIIPNEATTPSIAHWYGGTFASQCIEAPDDVVQNMVYDEQAGTFSALSMEPMAEDQIAALKEQLESTDYKLIKCSEYQLAGQDLPYDIAVLHTERQALRDQINALETST